MRLREMIRRRRPCHDIGTIGKGRGVDGWKKRGDQDSRAPPSERRPIRIETWKSVCNGGKMNSIKCYQQQQQQQQ